MVDVAVISGALGSIKIATDLLNGAKATRDAKLIDKALEEMQGALGEARAGLLQTQISMMALLDENRELKSKVVKGENFARQAKRYELHEVYPRSFTYRIKPSAQKGEPLHHACPSCFQASRIEILQGDYGGFGQLKLTCPSCKLSIVSGQESTR